MYGGSDQAVWRGGGKMISSRVSRQWEQAGVVGMKIAVRRGMCGPNPRSPLTIQPWYSLCACGHPLTKGLPARNDITVVLRRDVRPRPKPRPL